jgi:hypothetical protein
MSVPRSGDPELRAIELLEQLFADGVELLRDPVIEDLFMRATETRLLFRRARNWTKRGTPDRDRMQQAWNRYLELAVELKAARLKSPDIDRYHNRQHKRLQELHEQRLIIQNFVETEVGDEE